MSDFNVIYSYTTREAVEDGTLVKVDPDSLKRAGIRYPVYLTSAVWNRYVEVPSGLEQEQDLPGRLFDILNLFRLKAKVTQGNLLYFTFGCRLHDNGNREANESFSELGRTHRTVKLKAVVTAQDIDDPSPAIFIMKPNED